jgi:hypothetical protein
MGLNHFVRSVTLWRLPLSLAMVNSIPSAPVEFVSLQRSETFIDNAMNSKTGAPAERNAFGYRARDRLCFAPLEREEVSWRSRALINIPPLMGRRAKMFCCTSKCESTNDK